MHSNLLVACLVAVTLAACQRQQPRASVLRDAQFEQEPNRVIQGADFTISESGIPRVRIRAPRMAEYEGDSTYALLTRTDSSATRVLVTVFNAQGDTSATIFSDELYYYEGEDRYEARGNVLVISHNERRLESEHLAWNEPTATVRTPGFVRITTPDERIEGYQLEGDEDLSSYRLARVTGQITVRD